MCIWFLIAITTIFVFKKGGGGRKVRKKIQVKADTSKRPTWIHKWWLVYAQWSNSILYRQPVDIILSSKNFTKAPWVGWQIDPFGHSIVQAYLLSVELGFDFVFLAWTNHQDRAKWKDQKFLEVVWTSFLKVKDYPIWR